MISLAEVGETIEVRVNFGEKSHAEGGPPEVDGLHSFELWGKGGLLGLDMETHVVIDEKKGARESGVVFEFQVDGAVMLD